MENSCSNLPKNMPLQMDIPVFVFYVFNVNDGAVKMYERAGYQERGSVRYPFRSAPYKCFEKMIGGV